MFFYIYVPINASESESESTKQDIFSYELLRTSPLFHGDITTKLEKEKKLVASLEESLTRPGGHFGFLLPVTLGLTS